MLLSELKNNDVGIITKVRGRGAFRKRIMEMGFVRGKEVRVVKNAPLKDPVEYRIMCCDVSLRRSEASLIEVITPAEASADINNPKVNLFNGNGSYFSEENFREAANKEGKTINVALVGNPNAGKTTLFNFASGSHERVGNYSGVTVEAKTSVLEMDDYKFNIIDLPGTYSLSAYSHEELYVRHYILEHVPDIIINIVDASNLERNLFLTTQLIDMDVKVIMALNMYDELERRGDNLNCDLLGNLLGIPIIPTISNKGAGIKELFRKAIEVYEDTSTTLRHIHINYGQDTENAIKIIQKRIKIPENDDILNKYSSRFLALKLIEKDKGCLTRIYECFNKDEILSASQQQIKILENIYKEDTEAIITDAKYGFINGAIKETLTESKDKRNKTTEIIDSFLTHKVFGFPLFLFFIWIMFQATFKLGSYPMNWMDKLVHLLSNAVNYWMPTGILKDLIVDGVIGGVGGVIIFLPNILILFFFISLMEDVGYMARTAFIMDKLMHKIGLHGKSFIPLVMGFGCNVPAIMATRTLENRSNRLLTMLIIPFMSCSARLPIYILIIGAFFPQNPGTMLFVVYLIGILMAVMIAVVLKNTLFRNKEVPFVMELPPYRVPTLKSTSVHMWYKGREYLKKMGGVILAASIIIWAMGYFPKTTVNTERYNQQIVNIEKNAKFNIKNSKDSLQINRILKIKNIELNRIELEKKSDQQEHSFIGTIGKTIEPVLKPLGFDWKIGVSLISGAVAKEIVVSTLGIMYQADSNSDENSESLKLKLLHQRNITGMNKSENFLTPVSAFGFLLFVMLYIPCIATIAAIRRESGHLKWSLLLIAYSTTIAWTIAFIINQIGNLF
ncbi:MAG: ferrous iron transport protein B [Bacteroidota bacterium]|nr:ferrous iron transport protein B [Bacteroidota bacterium]